MFKNFLICVICSLICVICVYAQQTETLTITTYYPSPYGSYRELRSQRMAIGTTYYDGGTYPWYEGSGCGGALENQICDASLVVEGNVGIGTRKPATKLHIIAPPVEPVNQWRGQLSIEGTGSMDNVYMTFYRGPGGILGSSSPAGWIGYDSSGGSNGELKIGSYPLVLPLDPAPIVFTIGYEEVMRMARFGAYGTRVGIGEQTPRARLEIDGSTSTSSSVALDVQNSSDTSLLYVRDDGNVGIGTSSPSRTLEVNGTAKINNGLEVNGTANINGDLTASGNGGANGWVVNTLNANSGGAGTWTVTTLNATTINTTTYQGGPGIHGGHLHLDLAEDFRVIDAEPADVVVINPDDNESVVKSKQTYDSTVAGVISQEPAFRIGKTDKEGYYPLALAGRVLCKVTTENGPIKRGDLLVTSSKPGYAMKAEPEKIKPGMILGKALQPLKEGEDKILILVTLQ